MENIDVALEREGVKERRGVVTVGERDPVTEMQIRIKIPPVISMYKIRCFTKRSRYRRHDSYSIVDIF